MRFTKTTQQVLAALPVSMKGKYPLARLLEDYTTSLGNVFPAGTLVVVAGSKPGEVCVAITKDLIPNKDERMWSSWGNMAVLDKTKMQIFSRIDIELYN